MAEIIFCQKQKRFNSITPFDRWARLIVYEDDYADCQDNVGPFQFLFIEKLIGPKIIPVGISEAGDFQEVQKDYKIHETHIKTLLENLEEEKLEVDVILYTTDSRIKEAYYADYTKKMQLNIEIIEKKEIMYWATCGENNCGLIVAFEDLSVYKEGLEDIEGKL